METVPEFPRPNTLSVTKSLLLSLNDDVVEIGDSESPNDSNEICCGCSSNGDSAVDLVGDIEDMTVWRFRWSWFDAMLESSDIIISFDDWRLGSTFRLLRCMLGFTVDVGVVNIVVAMVAEVGFAGSSDIRGVMPATERAGAGLIFFLFSVNDKLSNWGSVSSTYPNSPAKDNFLKFLRRKLFTSRISSPGVPLLTLMLSSLLFPMSGRGVGGSCLSLFDPKEDTESLLRCIIFQFANSLENYRYSASSRLLGVIKG